jgi:hypothetical protein
VLHGGRGQKAAPGLSRGPSGLVDGRPRRTGRVCLSNAVGAGMVRRAHPHYFQRPASGSGPTTPLLYGIIAASSPSSCLSPGLRRGFSCRDFFGQNWNSDQAQPLVLRRASAPLPTPKEARRNNLRETRKGRRLSGAVLSLSSRLLLSGGRAQATVVLDWRSPVVMTKRLGPLIALPPLPLPPPD